MSDGAPRAPGHIRLSALARAIRSDRQGSNWGALVCARDHAWPLLDARHRSAEAKQADSRAASSNCIDHGVAPPGSLGSTLLSHAPSGAERRAAREDSHATRSHIADTLAVATFRWSPVSSGTCAGRRGVLYGHPGGGSATADAPGKAWSIRRCSRSGSRAASARMRHDWMARCAQCRTSVGWRCLETLGTPSALTPAEQGGAQGTGEQCAKCGEYAVAGCSWRWEEDSRPPRRGEGAK